VVTKEGNGSHFSVFSPPVMTMVFFSFIFGSVASNLKEFQLLEAPPGSFFCRCSHAPVVDVKLDLVFDFSL
jgi:hypothetical protein